MYTKENLERQEANKYGRGTERHLPKTDESVVRPTGGIAKTYRDETKENEYFGQITMAFLSSGIQETEVKL